MPGDFALKNNRDPNQRKSDNYEWIEGTISMMRSKFTKSHIMFALRLAETGGGAGGLPGDGISEATLYNWKKKYDGFGFKDERDPTAPDNC